MSDAVIDLPAPALNRTNPFPAHRGGPPYVFVSYAHVNAPVVFDDIRWLHERGVPIWYDEGITPGADWRDELADALASCSLFLLFASERALASPYCRQEINFALARNRRILLVNLEPVELPNALALSLADRQALERQNYSVEHFRERLFEVVDERGRSPRPRPPQDQATRPRSVAVLPLETYGADDDFLGTGIAAELVTGLAKIRDLDVAPRSTTFALAAERADLEGVAAKLRVRYVLDGTLRRSGDRLRVTTELFDAQQGSLIFSERYDRVIEDIFDVQEDIANTVTEALSSEFGKGLAHEVIEIGTRDPAAYQAYLLACHARYRLTPDAIRVTIAHLETAIAADPEFLEARILLITFLEALANFYGEDLTARIEAAEAAARKLDPEGARVNWFWRERSRAQSGPLITNAEDDEALFREMIVHADHPASEGLSPDRWFAAGFDPGDGTRPDTLALCCYGLLLGQAGLHELALRFLQASGANSFAAACCDLALGRNEEAEAFLGRYVAKQPDIVIPRVGQVALLQRLGRWSEAEIAAARLDHLLNDDLRVVMRIQTAYWQKDAAALEALVDRIPGLAIPKLFQGLVSLHVDQSMAIDYFTQSLESKEFIIRGLRLYVPFLLPPEAWQPLEVDPRFVALMDAMGLGERQRAMFAERGEALLARAQRSG